MHVTVLGWYGRHNVGDEAFKLCFEEGFRRLDLRPEIEFSSSSPGAVPYIILGGGDVIRSLYIEWIPPGTEIYALGVGLSFEDDIELLREHRVALALFRNERDVNVARMAGIDASYCPDLTFILPKATPLRIPSQGERKRLGVMLSDEISPTSAGISQREYSYWEYFKWELAAILDDLAPYYLIEFVPLSVYDSIDDRKVHQDVFRRMRKRSSVVLHDEELTVQQARDLISSFDLVVSMKYHGIVFAVQAGVPFINIAETRKSLLFCEENGLEALSIPKYSLQRDRFLDVVRTAEDPTCRSHVQRAARQLHAAASQAFPQTLEVYAKQALGL